MSTFDFPRDAEHRRPDTRNPGRPTRLRALANRPSPIGSTAVTSIARSAQRTPIDVLSNAELIERLQTARAALTRVRREAARLRVENKKLVRRLADLPAPSRPTPDIWLG